MMKMKMKVMDMFQWLETMSFQKKDEYETFIWKLNNFHQDMTIHLFGEKVPRSIACPIPKDENAIHAIIIKLKSLSRAFTFENFSIRNEKTDTIDFFDSLMTSRIIELMKQLQESNSTIEIDCFDIMLLIAIGELYTFTSYQQAIDLLEYPFVKVANHDRLALFLEMDKIPQSIIDDFNGCMGLKPITKRIDDLLRANIITPVQLKWSTISFLEMEHLLGTRHPSNIKSSFPIPNIAVYEYGGFEMFSETKEWIDQLKPTDILVSSSLDKDNPLVAMVKADNVGSISRHFQYTYDFQIAKFLIRGTSNYSHLSQNEITLFNSIKGILFKWS